MGKTSAGLWLNYEAVERAVDQLTRGSKKVTITTARVAPDGS
eukprot:gene47560-14845_t